MYVNYHVDMFCWPDFQKKVKYYWFDCKNIEEAVDTIIDKIKMNQKWNKLIDDKLMYNVKYIPNVGYEIEKTSVISPFKEELLDKINKSFDRQSKYIINDVKEPYVKLCCFEDDGVLKVSEEENMYANIGITITCSVKEEKDD